MSLQSMYANATINICRILIPDSAHTNSVKQAINGTIRPTGVSGNGGRLRPDPDFAQSDVDVAALAGENVAVFADGSRSVDLYCNAAWSPGDLIMSDASGYGIVATSGNYYVGRATGPGTVGTLCPIDVEPGLLKT